jgi:hypothetical protein
MAASLKAILSFDGRAYEAGMKKAQTTAKKTQANIVGSLKGAVAGALSVGFIASKAKEVGEFAKEVSELAPALGMTTDELQKWEYVFARFGLELSDTSDAFATLADRTEDALAGTESMIEDFRLVGITVDQLRGKNPQQLFELFADAVSNTSDKNRALTAIVRNLGDDLGRKLAPALMMGKKGLEEMRKEAEDLGIIMDGGNIQDVADQMVEMQIASMRLRAFWGDIVVILGQAFTWLSDGLKFINPWSKMMAAGGTFVGTLESGRGFFRAVLDSVRTVGNEYLGVIDEVEKREKAIEKRRGRKSTASTRSSKGINDEIEARKAQEALQKKINDAAFKQMSKEQQLNALFAQRLALFEKIRRAKTGKERFELMGQDFDLFQQMQGIQTAAATGTGSPRAMTQTASQGVGAFAKRANPLIQVGRQQLDVARQTLEVQRAMLARQQSAGRIF